MSRNVLIAAVASVGVHAALIIPLTSWKVNEVPRSSASSAAELIHVDVLKNESPRPDPSPKGEGGAHAPGGGSRHPIAVTEKAAKPITTAVLTEPTPGAFAPPSPEGEGSPVAASSPVASTTSTGSPVAVADPSVERELHQRLQSSASRCYPSASRRFHEQGTTEVSFCVGDTGQLAEGKLARSSGSERLDRAALECVIAGSDPFPAAHGRCFALPVKFGD